MNGLIERPGQTSILHTARGPLTLQTEITGEPPALVTILDFCGRVLKSFKRTLPSGSEPQHYNELAKRWHATVEHEVRESLRRRVPIGALAIPGPTAHAQSAQSREVVARLFTDAMAAYARRDLDSAAAMLEACEELLPGDAQVRAALAVVQRERGG
jgi:hypothetical protein